MEWVFTIYIITLQCVKKPEPIVSCSFEGAIDQIDAKVRQDVPALLALHWGTPATY